VAALSAADIPNTKTYAIPVVKGKEKVEKHMTKQSKTRIVNGSKPVTQSVRSGRKAKAMLQPSRPNQQHIQCSVWITGSRKNIHIERIYAHHS
jgi:hypothetical protein